MAAIGPRNTEEGVPKAPIAVQHRIPILVLGGEAAHAREAMAEAGVDEFLACRRGAPMADLVVAIKALLIGD